MSPRGVWGCSPQQLQSLQESLALSSNACALYILFARIRFIRAHISPLSNRAASGSRSSCLCVYPGAFPAGPHCVTLGGCALVWELRHRWWRDAAGAVVPSAFQEASVAHGEEGLARRARSLKTQEPRWEVSPTLGQSQGGGGGRGLRSTDTHTHIP